MLAVIQLLIGIGCPMLHFAVTVIRSLLQDSTHMSAAWSLKMPPVRLLLEIYPVHGGEVSLMLHAWTLARRLKCGDQTLTSSGLPIPLLSHASQCNSKYEAPARVPPG